MLRPPFYINHFYITISYIMIDTIHLFLPADILPDSYLLTTEPAFTNIDKKTSLTTGEITFYGYFKNFRVKQNARGIYIEGSLTKYYLGDNQKTLRPIDVPIAFIELSEDLGLPIDIAKVNRVDIAENIITRQPANQYYDVLGSSRYFRRLELNSGLGYESVNRYISFYDKKRELKKKNEIETDVFVDRNVLRVEYRFLKHKTLANYLDVPIVQVRDLVFHYPEIIKAWEEVFSTINKKHQALTFNNEVYQTKGAFDKQIKIMGVEAIGGFQELKKMINNAKASNLFTKYPNEPTNLLSRYKALMTLPKLTKKSNLTEELEKKIAVISFISRIPYTLTAGTSEHWF